MRSQFVFLLALFISIPSAFSQQRFTFSGYIRDAASGESLIGATLHIKEKPNATGQSNAYGYYSITLPAGSYQVTVHYMGYTDQFQTVDLTKPVKSDFALKKEAKNLSDVVVTGTRQNETVTQTRMGLQKLDIKEINNIPVLFGEKDVLKTIQLLPGIKAAGEGSSGFYVRGGAADQNLILLDEATVYNASHLLGFFSVFNSDAIKDVSIYKGNEPSEYGGRLSSVLDIRMKEENNQTYHVNGGVGLISSRLSLEGPIVKDKGSFILSARRTYADMFLKLSNDTSMHGTKLYFYDLNVKANYKLDDRNRVFLSGYFGQDVFGYKQLFGFDWGNKTGTLRWNHLFSDKLFSNTSLICSDYNYRIKLNLSAGDYLNIISRIQDFGLKQDFDLFGSEETVRKFGFSSIYHRIVPGEITAGDNYKINSLTNKYAWENALYVSEKRTLSEKLNLEYGLRLSTFSLFG
ncbi:MAG: TonB-dependent receptor, partial [Bacteroidota bacterium]|nr:TonB-dependent receptor [Bacteroidota bacterium]